MQTLKTSQKLGNYLANFAREIREAGGYTSIADFSRYRLIPLSMSITI